MSIVAIAAVAVAIKQMAESLRTVYGVLDGDRGVAIAVANHTSHELEIAWTSFDHGGWAEPPDQMVPPGEASLFSVRDKGFMTGTKGWLTYSINGSDPQCWAQIFWDNPFLGQNKAGCWDFSRVPVGDVMKKMFPEGLPVSAAGYRMTAISGTGNICQNKYEVFEG
ncbi:hypothetical protein KI427_21045 [Rhodococcus ruber]|uniref:hypothetical protein n=1 Tax=Rhodococcus TaxID=1827 RepID=UPI000E6B277E|nr:MULTISPECIES: hypothetical protein [Rhodococcus]UQB72021.1 hypothetical protein KI427_21045 [Rhodococcus ruber]WML61859.1 hypothetical protein QNA09_18635 [Rhodococcus sp. AH-ZY2]